MEAKSSKKKSRLKYGVFSNRNTAICIVVAFGLLVIDQNYERNLLIVTGLASIVTAFYVYLRHLRKEGEKIPTLTDAVKNTEEPDEIVFDKPKVADKIYKNIFLDTLYSHSVIKSEAMITVFMVCYLILNNGDEFLYKSEWIILAICVIESFFILQSYFLDIKDAITEKADYDIVNIVNDKGIFSAQVRLSQQKDANVNYIYTQHTHWSKVNAVYFRKKYTHMACTDGKNIYIFTNSDAQTNQLKGLTYKFFSATKKADEKPVFVFTSSSRLLDKLCRPRIALNTSNHNENIRIDQSYMTGVPALPPDFVWPTNHGLPLACLAQISCSQLAEFDTEHLLPETGTLCFFYEMKEMLMNEKGNCGCVRVVYNNSPADQLILHKDAGTNQNMGYLVNHFKLNMHKSVSMPNFDDACAINNSLKLTNEATYELSSAYYTKKKIENDNTIQFPDNESASLLGYPKDHTMLELGLNADEYILLFQLKLSKTSFYSYLYARKDYGEVGQKTREFYEKWTELPCVLYFFIPKEDLKRLDFSNLVFARRSQEETEAMNIDLSGL